MGKIGVLLFCSLLISSGGAWAQHRHDHGTKTEAASQKGEKHSAALEGWRITLEVMGMEEHMKHTAKGGGHGEADHAKSHMIMVTLQDTASKEIISDAKVSFSLSAPSGRKEEGKLVWTGDHYGSGIDLKEKGKHRVKIAIEGGGLERTHLFEIQRP